MAITYPLIPPAQPVATDVSFRLRKFAAVVGGEFSPVQRVYDWAGAAMWELQVSLPVMRRQQAELWISFLLGLDGPVGTFLYGDPDAALRPLNNLAGTPLVNGANQSGEDLGTDAWAAGQVFVPGTYIQIANGFYKIIRPAIADGSGNATLTLRPKFGVMGRASPADNAAIEYKNPRGLWRLTTPDQGQWSADRLSNYSTGFSAVEALE